MDGATQERICFCRLELTFDDFFSNYIPKQQQQQNPPAIISPSFLFPLTMASSPQKISCKGPVIILRICKNVLN